MEIFEYGDISIAVKAKHANCEQHGPNKPVKLDKTLLYAILNVRSNIYIDKFASYAI